MLHVIDVVSCIYVLCVSRVSFSNEDRTYNIYGETKRLVGLT